MALAILCSGQGRQHPDMFALTGSAPEAADLFEYSKTLFGGADPRELVRTGPSYVLYENRTGQILCTLQALAAFAALKAILSARLVIAGYSIGELAAWGVSGCLSPTATLELAARRAELMDAVSSPGDGMLFVRGLGRKVIDALCEQARVHIAIINPNEGYILGGNRAALDSAAELARVQGATSIAMLPISIASHTSLLNSVAGKFRMLLHNVNVNPAPLHQVRLISGIDGSAVTDVAIGLAKLSEQVSHTVRWVDCLQSCVEAQTTVFLELGPGTSLSKMVTGAYPGKDSRGIDDFRTLDGVRSWVAGKSG